MKQNLRSLFVGGLLPVIAFSLIEDHYGTISGLIAGMVFGVGEILYEWRTLGRVEALTWGGNGMLLVLGGVSLVTREGVWFKLQPALIEAAMAGALWVSVILKKPLLVSMAKKQGVPLDKVPVLAGALRGMTLRMGAFMAFHAVLATWAALHWSTAAWAVLKGVGFTLSMVLYGVAESLVLRYRFAKLNRLARESQSP